MKTLFKQQQIKNNNILCIEEQSLKKLSSNEQQSYIQYNFWDSKQDTMLIACAGSGKTYSMIEKVRFLINKQVMTRKDILIFSYSRLTINGIKNYCKDLQDYQLITDEKQSNIKTIDSFCYDIIKKIGQEQENCAVQVLSSRVLEMINETPDIIAKKIKACRYGKLKAIFIDEAQDLNETQYQIILFIKKCSNCSLHFIGDPNQNIYQFRHSFEKYFMKHQGQRFFLTKNFRCASQIELFSQYFQYYNQHEYKVNNDSLLLQQIDNNYINNNAQVLLSYQDQNDNDIFIIKYLQGLFQQGIQAHKIAFLSPTVGEQFQSGIKRIANLLDNNKIQYNVCYNDIKEETCKKKKQISFKSIDLLTIHGSKGLEYDYIILTKFADKMMYQENYDQQFFVSQNMNLLYVAITRAKKQLVIIHDKIQKIHICSILQQIPQQLFSFINTSILFNNNEQLKQQRIFIDSQNQNQLLNEFQLINNKLIKRKKIVDEDLEFINSYQLNEQHDQLLASKIVIPEFFKLQQSELMFTNSVTIWKTGVTRFIQQIPQQKLLELQKYVLYKKKCENFCTISDESQKLFKLLRTNHEALIGLVFEQVLFYQINQFQNKPPKFSKLLFNIKDQFYDNNQQLLKINKYFVVDNLEQMNRVIQFHQDCRNGKFNQQQIDEEYHFIEQEFLQQQQQINLNIYNEFEFEVIDFGNICNNQIQAFILASSQIFKAIDIYNQGLNWEQSLSSIIYLAMIKTAIKSKHQLYIHYNQTLIDKILEFLPLFKGIESIAQQLSQKKVKFQYKVEIDYLIGFIDFFVIDPITKNTTIIELKATNETSFEHILQVLIYDYLLFLKEGFNNTIIIINALKGSLYEFQIHNKQVFFEIFEKILQQDYQSNNIY